MDGHHGAPGEDDAPGQSDAAPRDLETEIALSVVVGSPQAVLAADEAGTVVWANAAASRLLGWPLPELVGRPMIDIAVPDERSQVLERRRRLLAGEDVSTDVVTCVRRDGRPFTAAVTRSVRRDPQGRLLGTSLVLDDISDEQRLRDDLTDALARFRARFDQVAMPQALLDVEGRFIAVNDAACHLLGHRREHLLGHDATRLVTPVDLAGTADRLRALRAGRLDSITYEVTAVRPDAAEVPLLIDASLVRDHDGEPREIAVFARDLSEVHEAQRRVADQEAFFTALYRSAADLVVVTDRENRLTYVSPSYTRVLGYAPEEVLGKVGRMFLHPDDLEASKAHFAKLRPGASARRLSRARDARGQWRWFDTVNTNRYDDPVIRGMVSNLRDVTTEIQTLERLRESEARYRAIVQTAQEGIIALAPDGSVLFANDTLAELMGVSLETIYAKGLGELLGPEEAGALDGRLSTRAERGPERYEAVYDHPDGSRRTWYVAASPLSHDDGSPMGSLGMVSDVTAAREAEAELRHAALHDALTGLPNRALLVDRIAMAGARQHRDRHGSLTVMFLDLDHFKLVNDSRGHEIGDRLLVEVASRLRHAVRDTDTVARLGGDEFAVICEDSEPAPALEVAARIQQVLAAPVDLGDESFYVSASIGIAHAPPHDVGDLLRFADAAMYDAKLAGRSQLSTFEGGERGTAARRLAIAAALREVLRTGAPTLGYQPVVDFRGDRLVGLEALLRWQHPELGDVAPDELLTAAETSGLSFDLDRAVIREAGDELVRLRAAGLVGPDVSVAVNISPRTAQQQRLDDLVREMLDRTGLPARCLTLEITEHAIMDNADRAVQLLQRLAEAGVRIAIDDFGTGYNSLVHLQRLPVSELKIDRSFVQDIESRVDSEEIARSVVGLASALGLHTVAEGIEHPGQVTALAALGCHRGQGYLWGRATLPGDLPGLLARWR